MSGFRVTVWFIKAIMLACFIIFASCERSCGKKQDADPTVNQELKNEKAAARVNNVVIAMEELNALSLRAADQFAKAGQKLPTDAEARMRGGILRKLMDDELIRQKAEQEGVKADRLERVEALEQFKAKLGGQKAYDLYRNQRNLTEPQVIRAALSELQRDKLLEKLGTKIEPTEEEIKKYYEANPTSYTMPDMVHARHILLKFDANDPKEKEDLVLKKAHEILSEARKENTSFEALVQKYSEGPSSKNGGDLGFFPRGRMVKSFEDAAFNAPLKKAVGPIKTDFGYHIIYVEEKRLSKVAPLDEVRDRVAAYVKSHKRSSQSEELLQSLRKAATVKIYDYSITVDDYLGKNLKVANVESK